jgi:2-polyprenyl-6-methoxyphenol hydroxylase-like FAD-dependent oxidoreductase
VRALVLGAGPAGLLTSQVLARHGFEVHLADPEPDTGRRTRPQSAHAHLWPTSAWQRLVEWLPELAENLCKRGVPSLSARALHLDAAAADDVARPWPDRPTLDATLWSLCRPRISHVHARRVGRIDFAERCIRAPLTRHDLLCDVVVDASGAARATLASLAATCGRPIPLVEGPPSGGYVTFQVRNVHLAGDRSGHAGRDTATGCGAILLRDAGNAWRLTLQMPPGVTIPLSLRTALDLLGTFTDTRIADACRGAFLLTTPQRFGGHPPARLALEETTGLPDGWLPIGDCVLATPPYLGQGLDQLTEQVELIDTSLAVDESWPQIRDRIVRRAQERWWGATWIEALRVPGAAWASAAPARVTESESGPAVPS